MLDEWFFGQDFAGVTVVAEASSQPLREDLRLTPGPVSLAVGESLLAMAVFPEAGPEAIAVFLQAAAEAGRRVITPLQQGVPK